MSQTDEDKSQKTEEPTPHRLEKAYEKGQFPISKELSHGLMLLSFMGCFFLIFPFCFKELIRLLQQFLITSISSSGPFNYFYPLCKNLIAHVASLFIIPGLMIMGTAFIAGLGQTRFRVSTEALKPSLERISPAKGLSRIFSFKSIFDFLKNVIKLVFISGATYGVMAPSLKEFINYPALDLSLQMDKFSSLLFRLVITIVIIIFILAVLDYFYERWSHLRNLRMSKQEIKDEHKEMEGDPYIKNRLRQIRRERARRRLAQEIPQATVIITNPTHYAVALKYEWGKNTAPIVIAKGMDFVALLMRELAKDHRIPIVENPPLARSLYKAVKEGKEIPVNYYEAVAKVIRYVYNLKQRKN